MLLRSEALLLLKNHGHDIAVYLGVEHNGIYFPSFAAVGDSTYRRTLRVLLHSPDHHVNRNIVVQARRYGYKLTGIPQIT